MKYNMQVALKSLDDALTDAGVVARIGEGEDALDLHEFHVAVQNAFSMMMQALSNLTAENAALTRQVVQLSDQLEAAQARAGARTSMKEVVVHRDDKGAAVSYEIWSI